MLAFKLDPAVELALRRQRSVALKEGTFFTTGYGKRHFIFLRALRERWVAIELTASNCALIARCRSGKCSFTALRFDDLDGIEILSSPAGAPTDDVIEDAFNLRAARVAFERSLIGWALVLAKNNIAEAARLIGTSKRALQRRIKNLSK